MIDVNLTGVWHTAKATIPHLRAAGGGSIIITSSGAGLKGTANLAHYVAAKHGLVGLLQRRALPRLRRGPLHHRVTLPVDEARRQ